MNKKRIVRCKARIRDILREIREVNASHARLPTAGGEGEGDDDGVAADDIVCSKCGGGDADEDDENDILLCDLERCNRAYHQKCVDPPVSTADIPPGDESWFCAECACYLTALAIVNEEFETDADSPSELFPAVDRQRQSTSQAAEAGGVVGSGDGANNSRDQGSAHSTRGAAQEALLASDSDDSDFDPQEFKQVRRLHATFLAMRNSRALTAVTWAGCCGSRILRSGASANMSSTKKAKQGREARPSLKQTWRDRQGNCGSERMEPQALRPKAAERRSLRPARSAVMRYHSVCCGQQ